jgi:hypothetical protein
MFSKVPTGHRFVAASLGAAALLAVVAPVNSEAVVVACAPRSTSAAFSRWGDNNLYFPVTNAGFETSGGWSITGSGQYMSENEPWNITAGSRSMSLYNGSTTEVSATAFCADQYEDSIRFAYKRPATTGAYLQVKLWVVGASGFQTVYHNLPSGPAGWVLSPRIPLPDLRGALTTQNVTLSFLPQGTPASWRIDSVMVDPWRPR